MDHYRRHLLGEGPYLGIVPIRTDLTCAWGAIDYDTKPETADLAVIEARVREFKLPLVACWSKSKGAHLYLFGSEPLPAALVVERLQGWCTLLRIEKSFDGRKTEIFPKQVKLDAEQPGNWINLPYHGGDGSIRHAMHEGKALGVAGFLELAKVKAVTVAQLRKLADPFGDDLPEAPPCLQTIFGIGRLPEGARDQGLYNLAIYYRKAFPDAWQERVREANARLCVPPCSAAQVEKVVASVDRNVKYFYKCEERPIAEHCNKALCKKRRHGIGGHGAGARADFPEIDGCTKIMTDPVTWQVTVDGQVMELTSEEFLRLPAFQKACLERLNFVPPTIAPREWHAKVSALAQVAQVVEAPPDAGTRGAFLVLLGEFLDRHDKAEEIDDVLRGLPFVEQGRAVFQSTALHAFLTRKGFKEYSPRKVWMELKALGAEHARRTIGGAQQQVWSLPAPAVKPRPKAVNGAGDSEIPF